MKVRLEGPGGAADGDLAAGPLMLAPASGGAAALAVSGGLPYLQPLPDAAPVFLNDHRLAAAQWLRDGDVVRIGAQAISVRVQGSGIALAADGDVVLSPCPPAIEPRPPPPAPAPRRRRVRGIYVGGALAALAVVLWFVFSARMLQVDIQPAPDKVSLDGGLPAFLLADGYLALPGRYRLSAERSGYRPLAVDVDITAADRQRVELKLEKLPGYLSVTTPGVTGAEVLVNGAPAGRTPLADLELAAGRHPVVIRADGYAEFSGDVEIEGLGQRQTLSVALIPASAAVTVQSATAGARLWVDGAEAGALPLTTQMTAGNRSLEIRAPRHKPWKETVEVVAGEAQTIGPVTLAPADGVLRVDRDPPGASVAVDGRYAGATPATLALAPDRDHRITVSKAGYGTATRAARLKAGEEARLSVALSAEQGRVTLDVEPRDAQLSIEGRTLGTAHGTHQLAAVPTLLEIRREGFEAAQVWVTPKPGFEQSQRVRLRPAGTRADALPDRITAPDGTVMLLVRPGTFTMGASRRDPGQRANETLREVRLTRPYYLGATEVTNAQFAKFRPAHRSGRFDAIGLEGASHPVVNVTWADAAAYCNALNDAAKLPPVYAAAGGTLAAATPVGPGYRLPTEAEWAFAARVAGVRQPSRFPWGDALPPPAGSGNFADRSVATTLADTLKDYDDGHAGTAPVGSFKAGPAGFFDLAGNAAEWVHDAYGIPAGGKPETDPRGPDGGKHHVIRGSSWMHGSVSPLRWTWRDYGSDARPDVGFRCARYATAAAP
ncbi:MAG TPA: SUMF1/EgtB/PvdO family nonheme iron enzyme [Pelomicrobium sp.]|nr:SUMF1/EgtB/PvdO family nonheme iron enzyme [Pelomicrobium sp.]